MKRLRFKNYRTKKPSSIWHISYNFLSKRGKRDIDEQVNHLVLFSWALAPYSVEQIHLVLLQYGLHDGEIILHVWVKFTDGHIKTQKKAIGLFGCCYVSHTHNKFKQNCFLRTEFSVTGFKTQRKKNIIKGNTIIRPIFHGKYQRK